MGQYEVEGPRTIACDVVGQTGYLDLLKFTILTRHNTGACGTDTAGLLFGFLHVPD